jgi:cytochrome bd-type quinol oxidase subunit 2
MVRKILLTCGIVSSVLYITVDVLGSLRYPGYRYTEQQFSELTAQGSPVRSLMVGLSVIPYTLLVAAFAVGVFTSAPQEKRAGRIAGAMLLGYAAFGMVGGWLTPMHTREALEAGERGLRNATHVPMTAVMSLFVLLAMGFGPTLLGKRFRYYSYATIAVLVVFGLLTSLQAGKMVANETTPWMGLTERVNIYATMLWVAVMAIGLLRAQENR